MFNKRTNYAVILAWTLSLIAVSLSSSTRAQAQSAPETPALYQRSYDAEAVADYQGALSALESIPRADTDSFIYQLRHGWLLYLVGRYEEAIVAYRAASETAPAAIEPHLGMMLPQMAMRRWQDAEQTGRHVLEVDPMSYLARRRLALVLYNLGRYGDAEELYRGVIEHYPADVEARSGLGWSLQQQGESAEAARLFREVLEVSPNEYSAVEGLQAATR